jgi:hypothetical protein
VALTGAHHGSAWCFISVQNNSVYTLFLQMKTHPASERKLSVQTLPIHTLSSIYGNSKPGAVSISCLKNIFSGLFSKVICSVYALNRQAVEPLATYQNKRRHTHAG